MNHHAGRSLRGHGRAAWQSRAGTNPGGQAKPSYSTSRTSHQPKQEPFKLKRLAYLVALSLSVALPMAHEACATTFTVTSQTDDGTGTTTGTLSWAIAQVNQGSGGDSIAIDASAVPTITISGAMPTLTKSSTLTIANGFVQLYGGAISTNAANLVFNDTTEIGLVAANGADGSNFSNSIGSWGYVPPGAYGGAGAAGITMTGTSQSAHSTMTNNGGIVGGNGGKGGDNTTTTAANFSLGPPGAPGGSGGSGFSGQYFTLNNNGNITGGYGGAGGAGGAGVNANGSQGAAGSGGAGVSGDHFFISNHGSITGGNGAVGGGYGAGGVGVVSTGGSSIINDGIISGGLSGDGVTRADAVDVSGGGNAVYLYAGAQFVGNVVSTSGQNQDWFGFNGATNTSFDMSQVGQVGSGAKIQGFNLFDKNGTNTLTLTGATASSMQWQISNGTLALGGSGALGGASSSVMMYSGTTLDLGGTTATANNGLYMIGGTVQNGTFSSSGSFTLQAGQVNAVLAGTGSLNKSTSGTVTLTGVNTYTGGTTVAGGTLVLSGGGTLGAASGSVGVSGGTLDLGGTTATANGGVTMTGGTIQNGSLSSSGTFDLQAGQVGANLVGAGSLNKSSSGTVTLTGANAYTGGTMVSGGTLSLSGGGTLGATSGSVVMSGGTLDLGGTGVTANGGVTMTGGTIKNGSLSSSGPFELQAGHVGANLIGAGTLNKSGNGTVTLTGANTYTGNTTVSGGTLALSGGGTLGATSGSVGVSGGTLDLGGTSAIANGGVMMTGGTIQNGTLSSTGTFDLQSGLVAANLGGSAALVKLGAGLLTLNGSNTYSGGTNVNGGLLEVGDAGHAAASLNSNVTVNTGGTLGGHGTVNGNVTVNQGANVNPGGSIGILTVSGNYTQNANGTLTVEVTPNAGTPGVGYDQLNVGGTASLAGNLSVLVGSGSYTLGSRYDIVHAGSVTGAFDNVAYSPQFANYIDPVLSYAAQDVYLTLKPGQAAYTSAQGVADQAWATRQSLFDAAGVIGGDHPAKRGIWLQALRGQGWANHAAVDQGGVLLGGQISGRTIGSGVLTLGAAFTALNNHTDTDSQSVQGHTRGLYGYGVYRQNAWRLAATVGGGRLTQTSHRYLNPIGMVASGDTSGWYGSASVEGSYRIDLTQQAHVSPYVGAAYLHAATDAYDETGAGILNLRYHAQSFNVGQLKAGIRAGVDSTPNSLFHLMPWVRLGVVSYVGDRSVGQVVSLGPYAQQLTANAAPDAAFDGGIGVSLMGRKSPWQVILGLNGQYASGSHFNSVDLKASYHW